MRRLLELTLVLAAVSLWAWFGLPKPPHQGLAFNGVRPGERLADVEARLGRPDFSNPRAMFCQWEHPLTQVRYDARHVLIEVAGSGTGVLTRDGQPLLRCGDPEQAVEKALGRTQDQRRYSYHHYPGLTIHCGSESNGQRWVSYIRLNRVEPDVANEPPASAPAGAPNTSTTAP